MWIGWPGDTSGLTRAQRAEVDRRLEEMKMVPVHLAARQVERYYEGFANGVLWPLFHYLLDKVRLEAWRDWEAYRDANEQFANAVAAVYRPGDRIWVHDYQLALVPGMLRERLPEAAIGYFLHIPFPASGVFRILPWRTQILQGLMGADVIGFHTYSYQRHFASCLLRLLGVDADMDAVEYQGRTVRLGAFPISIDTAHFAEGSATPRVEEKARAIREQHRGCKILLGVDRLDYTKGLKRRVLAVERMFERSPELCGKVKFIQVAVPSRTKVEAYGQLRRSLDELVGRVNGRFSTVHWSPVQYLYRQAEDEELLALYRAADVMLVTPLRDGMNLVAKEFVACRHDEDGVLVLSEFAGAAWELGEALMVNPYNVDQSAQAIQQAIEMPAEQRRYRMRLLRKRVFSWTVREWVNAFDRALEEVSGENLRIRETTTLPREVIARVKGARHVVLILDYDGTLVPFAPTPELALPDKGLLELLHALARRPNTEVHLASGRDRETLGEWLGGLPISLHAEHGFWSRLYGEQEWTARAIPANDWKQRVRCILEDFAARTPGAMVEEKSAALCWHYRLCEPEFAEIQERELRLHLADLLRNQPAEVITGNKIVEVRQIGVHKGLIASSVCASMPDGAVVVAMGDDTTDEDLFACLPSDGISIHVGPKQSRARYRMARFEDARELLRQLLEP